jgi:hypothetical protein
MLSNAISRLLIFLTCLAGLATAQSFAELKALYQYDQAPPIDVKSKQEADRTTYKLYSLEYANPNNLRIHGFLILPKEVVPKRAGRNAAIVWMHSNGMWAWLGDAVLMIQTVIAFAASGGRAHRSRRRRSQSRRLCRA